jgi:hypothetical protein
MTLTMSWVKAQRAIGRPATTAHEAVQNAASFVRFNAAAAADHAQKVCLIFGLHHEGGDAVLCPLLWERGAEQAAAIVPSMEEQHHGIEAALHDVNALVPGWQSTAQNGENLVAAIDAPLDRLQEHMAQEEKEIGPLAEKFVTAAEWPGSEITPCPRPRRRTFPGPRHEPHEAGLASGLANSRTQSLFHAGVDSSPWR